MASASPELKSLSSLIDFIKSVKGDVSDVVLYNAVLKLLKLDKVLRNRNLEIVLGDHFSKEEVRNRCLTEQNDMGVKEGHMESKMESIMDHSRTDSDLESESENDGFQGGFDGVQGGRTFVVGDQSVGKTTIVISLSGVPLAGFNEGKPTAILQELSVIYSPDSKGLKGRSIAKSPASIVKSTEVRSPVSTVESIGIESPESTEKSPEATVNSQKSIIKSSASTVKTPVSTAKSIVKSPVSTVTVKSNGSTAKKVSADLQSTASTAQKASSVIGVKVPHVGQFPLKSAHVSEPVCEFRFQKKYEDPAFHRPAVKLPVRDIPRRIEELLPMEKNPSRLTYDFENEVKIVLRSAEFTPNFTITDVPGLSGSLGEDKLRRLVDMQNKLLTRLVDKPGKDTLVLVHAATATLGDVIWKKNLDLCKLPPENLVVVISKSDKFSVPELARGVRGENTSQSAGILGLFDTTPQIDDKVGRTTPLNFLKKWKSQFLLSAGLPPGTKIFFVAGYDCGAACCSRAQLRSDENGVTEGFSMVAIMHKIRKGERDNLKIFRDLFLDEKHREEWKNEKVEFEDMTRKEWREFGEMIGNPALGRYLRERSMVLHGEILQGLSNLSDILGRKIKICENMIADVEGQQNSVMAKVAVERSKDFVDKFLEVFFLLPCVPYDNFAHRGFQEALQKDEIGLTYEEEQSLISSIKKSRIADRRIGSHRAISYPVSVDRADHRRDSFTYWEDHDEGTLREFLKEATSVDMDHPHKIEGIETEFLRTANKRLHNIDAFTERVVDVLAVQMLMYPVPEPDFAPLCATQFLGHQSFSVEQAFQDQLTNAIREMLAKFAEEVAASLSIGILCQADVAFKVLRRAEPGAVFHGFCPSLFEKLHTASRGRRSERVVKSNFDAVSRTRPSHSPTVSSRFTSYSAELSSRRSNYPSEYETLRDAIQGHLVNRRCGECISPAEDVQHIIVDVLFHQNFEEISKKFQDVVDLLSATQDSIGVLMSRSLPRLLNDNSAFVEEFKKRKPHAKFFEYDELYETARYNFGFKNHLFGKGKNEDPSIAANTAVSKTASSRQVDSKTASWYTVSKRDSETAYNNGTARVGGRYAQTAYYGYEKTYIQSRKIVDPVRRERARSRARAVLGLFKLNDSPEHPQTSNTRGSIDEFAKNSYRNIFEAAFYNVQLKFIERSREIAHKVKQDIRRPDKQTELRERIREESFYLLLDFRNRYPEENRNIYDQLQHEVDTLCRVIFEIRKEIASFDSKLEISENAYYSLSQRSREHPSSASSVATTASGETTAATDAIETTTIPGSAFGALAIETASMQTVSIANIHAENDKDVGVADDCAVDDPRNTQSVVNSKKRYVSCPNRMGHSHADSMDHSSSLRDYGREEARILRDSPLVRAVICKVKDSNDGGEEVQRQLERWRHLFTRDNAPKDCAHDIMRFLGEYRYTNSDELRTIEERQETACHQMMALEADQRALQEFTNLYRKKGEDLLKRLNSKELNS